tara:strand:- start:11 stop:247 length:237 start_codon:yes stop_codon:yes gene_type:complete
MEMIKDVKDIKFSKKNFYGQEIEVSEPIVMASAAGWYVGAICKEDGIIQPFDRYTQYMPKEHAQYCLNTPKEQGGFSE